MSNQSLENRLLPINKKDFGHLYFKKFTHYRHASGDSVIPIVLMEVGRAMMDTPLAFMQDEQGKYQLVAIASFINNVNVLIDQQGYFRTSYVPACYRSYPFLSALTQEGERVLCFDKASDLLTENPNEGEAFFDEKGEISPHLKNIMTLLHNVTQNTALTQQAISTLTEYDLIAPWELSIEEQKIMGLYRINEEKLFKLKAEEMIKIRDCGALTLAYAQLFSMQHVIRIKELTKAFLLSQQQTPQTLVNEKGDLDLEFLNNNDTIPV